MKTKETYKIDEAEANRLKKVAFILKTVAHPTRLGIIKLLEVNENLSVSDISEQLGTEQSLTSHHLQNMHLKGILSVERDGRSRKYSLKERDVLQIIDCLDNCQCNIQL